LKEMQMQSSAELNISDIRGLMESYGEDVWNYAYVITKNAHTADDVAQDVFIKAYQHAASFRGEASLKSIQGGGAFQSSFEPGAGGDYEWWSSAENETKQGNDRTIVTLGIAFMKRELGIWGGPTPDIWEHPEVKTPLERYDVSSPWVYEMYVDQIRTDETQTIYELRLRLRDSIPMVYEEMIDVTIQNDTHRISHIEERNTDDTGTPPEEYGP